MSINPILDDDISQNEPNFEKFESLYEGYLGSLYWAVRWRLAAIITVFCLLGSYLVYAHTNDKLAWKITFCLFFAAGIVAVLAYAYHFFALQKAAVILYLFPKSKINGLKIISPWLLFPLSVILFAIPQYIHFPDGVIFTHFSEFIIYLSSLHACFVGVQQLLLRRYRIYIPAIFSHQPLSGLGYPQFACWIIGIVLFLLSFYFIILSFRNREMGLFSPLCSAGMILTMIIYVFYDFLHSHAEAYKEKEGKKNEKE